MTTKQTFIYGVRAVLEAIDASTTIQKIMIDRKKNNPSIKQVIYKAQQCHIPLQFLPSEKFISFQQKNHQGVVAIISPIEFQSLENIIYAIYQQGKYPLILALDGITDVRNFGAIARTALSAGVHAIIIEEKGAASINDDAIKTSAGALLHIPICREKSLHHAIKELQSQGLKAIACTEKGDISIYKTPLQQPVVIIMGSEEKGISPSILNIADYHSFIPIKGDIASLNVSVACGIILYEAVRQIES